MLLDSLRHTLCFGNHPKQQHHKSCKILQIFLATRPTHHCSHYTFLPYFSHIFFSYLLLLVTNIYPNFKKNRVSGLDHLLHLFVFHFLLHLFVSISLVHFLTLLLFIIILLIFFLKRRRRGSNLIGFKWLMNFSKTNCWNKSFSRIEI
jgi:hypothetical protein